MDDSLPSATITFAALEDDTPTTGYDPHYVLHTGWAARKLAASKPSAHHDFGGSMYFAAIVSAFVPFVFHDIRPPNLPFENIGFERADLTRLPFKSDYLHSVSCLHVLEHVGLGRYGDMLDVSGDRKAARELMRVLMPGGKLLLAVPMEDPAKVCFNAHRLYSYAQVIELFAGMRSDEFSLITNRSEFFPNCPIEKLRGEKYACGCFEFTKP